MATKSKNIRRTAANTTVSVAKGPVCCLNCEHALLHRYGTNPILAACKCQPQQYDERFPYVVEVASYMRHCSNWELATGEKEIEIRSKAA